MDFDQIVGKSLDRKVIFSAPAKSISGIILRVSHPLVNGAIHGIPHPQKAFRDLAQKSPLGFASAEQELTLEGVS